MPTFCNEQPSLNLLVRWGVYEAWVNGLLGFDSLPDGIGQVSLLDVECCLPQFCGGKPTSASVFFDPALTLQNPDYLNLCIG